jgi:hypothetical protein
MKVLVCGSREWADKQTVRTGLTLLRLSGFDTLIHGACRGADTIAGELGKELGFEVISVPANWKEFGRSAGMIRNREMLDMHPDLVLAYHLDIENSRGTKDCIAEAKKRCISTMLVNEIYGEDTL